MIYDYRRLRRAINDTDSIGWRFISAFSMQSEYGKLEKPSLVNSEAAKNR
jgi:hypothetical protein